MKRGKDDISENGIILIADVMGRAIAQYNNWDDAREFLKDITTSGYPTRKGLVQLERPQTLVYFVLCENYWEPQYWGWAYINPNEMSDLGAGGGDVPPKEDWGKVFP